MIKASPHFARRVRLRDAFMLAIAIALAPLAAPVHAQHYVVEWPAARQHLLEGRYTGHVRDQSRREGDSEFQTADLLIERDGQYVISLECDDGAERLHTIRGHWWIDEIAGSCLILVGPDASSSNDDYRYGFRIHGNAHALHQDGGRCQSADERDAGMVLTHLEVTGGE